MYVGLDGDTLLILLIVLLAVVFRYFWNKRRRLGIAERSSSYGI